MIRGAIPLIKNIFTLSAKSVLILIGLTATVSTTDATIQKKIYGTDRLH